MISKDEYTKYKYFQSQLNSISFWGMENVQCGTMLSYAIGNAILGNGRWAEIIRGLISSCCVEHYDFDCDRDGGGILFVMTHRYISRPDFYERFFKIASTVSSKDVITPKPVFRKWSFLHVGLIARGLVWLYQMRKIAATLLQKMCFINAMLTGKAYLDEFKRKLPLGRYALAVTCMDSQVFDNILTQYFRSQGSKTATMQDGHPIMMAEEVYQFNHFMPAFRGFISDYYLAWGEYYKGVAVASGITPERVVCLGMPKCIDWQPARDDECEKAVFAVMLDYGGESTNNVSLLEAANYLAEELGMRYVAKYHPSDDASAISSLVQGKNCIEICPKAKSVESFLRGMVFAIGCSSAIVIESLLYCKIVMRMVPSKEGYDFLGAAEFPFEFKTKEEALELYRAIQEDAGAHEARHGQYATYMCGAGIYRENYREFFTHVLDKNGAGAAVPGLQGASRHPA